MASYFVSSASGAGGAGNGSSWANAYLTLAGALTGKAAGDVFFVGDDHNEINSSFATVSGPNGVVYVLCADHTKASPASADLKIGAAGAGSIRYDGGCSLSLVAHYYGIYFDVGQGVTTGNAQFVYAGSSSRNLFKSCTLKISATGGTVNRLQASGGTICYFVDCTFIFTDATQVISSNTNFTQFSNCVFQFSGTVPSPLFAANVSGQNNLIEACDFSAFTGAYLVNLTGASNLFTFKDCKLPTGQPLFSFASAGVVPVGQLLVANSDGIATNYRTEHYMLNGETRTSTTVVKTGGASQGTAYSWKINTFSNNLWAVPYRGLPISIWNATTGAAKNVTIEGLADPRNFSALPNNDEVWFDVEALQSASFPQGAYSSGTKANVLATGSALTASTAAWDTGISFRTNSTAYNVGDFIKSFWNSGVVFVCTTPGTSASTEPPSYLGMWDGGSVTDGTAVFTAMWRFKQTITTGTIRMAGLITVYPKVAKASLVGIYIDPMITLS